MEKIIFPLLLLTGFSMPLFGQGSLTPPPPGAPGPTMKTLQQIEPRIDLQNAPAAAVTTTDANYHFIINQSGSYYLSANLDVTKPNGIQINAAGVTLDLNDFEISRTSGTGGTGISITTNTSVHDGSLKGFANGFSPQISPSYCILRNLVVSNCSGTGIRTGAGSIVENCRVHNNSGGIYADRGCRVSNCTAFYNAGPGITTDASASIDNCTVVSNTGDGITVNANCIISYCTVTDNNDGIHAYFGAIITQCTVSSNKGNGIYAYSPESAITRCVANQNKGNGIQADGNGISVIENTCYGNGLSTPTASGIYVSGNGCRVEGNTAYGNGFGIALNTGTSGNLVIHNHAMNNTTAGNYYSPSANNIVGTIVNSSAALNAAGNSMVNVSYP